MIAKMAGFSLGPLAFLFFGSNLLYLAALGYLVEAALLWRISDSEAGGNVNANTPVLRNIHVLGLENSRIVMVGFLNGFLSFPFIALALYVLSSRFDAQTIQITLFWIATSAVSVSVNYFISQGIIKRFGRLPLTLLSSASVCLALAFVFMAPNAGLLIFGFCFFTLGNPILGVISRNLFFHAVGAQERRRMFGVIQTAAAIGVSLGVAILISGDVIFYDDILVYAFMLLSILIMIRAFLIGISTKKLERLEAGNMREFD